MPFKSKAQQRAAFSGALGSKMKKRAKLWAEHTPNIEDLPEHANTEKSLNLWKGKIISLDMAYEEKLLKAYSGEKQKKLQWQKKTKTGKVITAHRRKVSDFVSIRDIVGAKKWKKMGKEHMKPMKGIPADWGEE
jgi:hypothetical protein